MGNRKTEVTYSRSVTATELTAGTVRHWYDITTGVELQVKQGEPVISAYSLPSTGGTSTLRVHITGDDATTLRDIEIADTGAMVMLPSIDYIDLANSTIDASLILIAE